MLARRRERDVNFEGIALRRGNLMSLDYYARLRKTIEPAIGDREQLFSVRPRRRGAAWPSSTEAPAAHGHGPGGPWR
jgi:hypothetical protein